MKFLKSLALSALVFASLAGSALAQTEKPSNEAHGLRCYPIVSPPTCTSAPRI
jgi:hypothetical protein